MCECESEFDDIHISGEELAVYDPEYCGYRYFKINFCPFCGKEVEKRKRIYESFT